VKLRGTEALTLEVGASLPPSRARATVPARFEVPSAEGGEARGSLLFFRMTGLAMDGLPFPSFDYGEALWRISVRLSGPDGVLAWFAVACDIDNPIVRALGARLVRYPTRAAKIIASEAKWKVDGSAAGGTSQAPNDGSAPTPETALELKVSDVDVGEIPTLRRTFVASGDRIYEIPWDEIPPARARSVRVTTVNDGLVRTTFGEGAKLDETGIVHRGRVHMCWLARRDS
jgi:hypothetical protein